ncbi:MAG: AbrB/MazE/SpoVT family DNA-binding domain-containing protein [Nitrososphaeraceae archaeon]|nr:AbrB/MazE/SpoVT family DNA-binding domain-containing protein [Nitrososphaeraceae archaeon]
MNLSEESESSSDIRNPDMYRRIQGILGEQSYSLVLPKIFATNLGIRKGDYVKVRQLGAKIIVEKA